MKKLLILGGKPIGSYEIVEYAKSLGIYTIVTDYLPEEKSVAKAIADETWDISTADIETLAVKAKDSDIDGVYTGVNEFNVGKMVELCELIDLPCFCNKEQWYELNNKKYFKRLCNQYEIPVTDEYLISEDSLNVEPDHINYPVIIKPSDGSGSRGFNICNNFEELKSSYEKAKSFSKTKSVIVEKMMNYKKSVIINYTLVDGIYYFSGMSDKHSKKIFKEGAPIMSAQFYPSILQEKYLNELDEKVKKMFKGYGLKNGVIWIEAFYDDNQFYFNEMGYRFGGSLTYLPVKKISGIDQLSLQLEYALTGENLVHPSYTYDHTGNIYCILPVHLKSGRIAKIEGVKSLKELPGVLDVIQVHHTGDEIKKWGSAQQVFSYIHFSVKNKKEAEEFITEIPSYLKVYNDSGNDMLFTLYRED